MNIDWSLYLRLHQSRVGRFVARAVLRGQRREQFGAIDGNIIVHDLRSGIPTVDNCVDVVYHSHVLEHMDRGAVPAFMGEVLRVLKPGGVHRVVVPDLERVIGEYLESLREGHSDHDWHVWALYEQSVRREAAGTSQQPVMRRGIENLVLGDARKRGETHQWMYDRRNLAEILEENGFVRVHRVDAHTSDIPGWADTGLDIESSGAEYKPGSLFMEAHKPA